jgi:hypothetical protein
MENPDFKSFYDNAQAAKSLSAHREKMALIKNIIIYCVIFCFLIGAGLGVYFNKDKFFPKKEWQPAKIIHNAVTSIATPSARPTPSPNPSVSPVPSSPPLPVVDWSEQEELESGYQWAKNMDVRNNETCDQFTVSHGEWFVNGCKEYVKTTQPVATPKATSAPTPTPTPTTVSIPTFTPTPTSVPIPTPTPKPSLVYLRCEATINANPFLSESGRQARLQNCYIEQGNLQGCCSSHGGVSSCSSARVVCKDGQYSPSCLCE